MSFHKFITEDKEITKQKSALLNLLVPISHKCHTLGVAEYTLEGLKYSYDSNTVKLSKILSSWNDTMCSPRSWNNLIQTLNSPAVDAKNIGDKLSWCVDFMYKNGTNLELAMNKYN